MDSLWNRITRVARHCWGDESDLKRIMSSAMFDQLEHKISLSEQRHSGEIRICVEVSLPWAALWKNTPNSQIFRERALTLFAEMGVWDTANNNGVLIYVLLAERHIEIIADRGINAHVAPDHWNVLVKQMGQSMQKGTFEEGLKQGIDNVTETLCRYFPSDDPRNPNELPDRPVLR